MLTMRGAATLLAGSRAPAGLAELLQGCGILSSPPVPCAADEVRALRIDPVVEPQIAAAGVHGRVLLGRMDMRDFRSTVQRIATRLDAQSPHVLWLLALVDEAGATAALVAWERGERSRRIAAFRWDTTRPLDSDAETLVALQAARCDEDVLSHRRITEVLGRDSLTRRFYRVLEAQVGALAACAPRAHREHAGEIALLYVSRLLFLSFLEAKGWLDGERGFLSARFDACMQQGGQYHRRVLLPLFFGTLNTPVRHRAPAARALGRVPFLNGGLFTRTPVERRAGRWTFSDERLGALFSDLFHRFRFVAREDSATWSEASVDPEMLGRAFESLMTATDRKSGGVFFTPHELVARVTEEAIGSWRQRPSGSLGDLRVLDPACGSGAFLVYALERLAVLRQQEGDSRPTPEVRRDVLARSIFGVDRNPTAVWLCELRLWLSVVIELDEPDPLRVPPLPNLDRNIRVGDALSGDGLSSTVILPNNRTMAELRARYVRASGTRKATLARRLDRLERVRTLDRLDREVASLRHARQEQAIAMRSRDLFGERTGLVSKAESRRLRARLRTARAEWQRVALGGALPFSFAAMFAEAHAAGGFDLVVGNPPWVRLHRIPEALRASFRESFEVYRAAAWATGARSARAASGFASQVDLSALFVERSLALLRDSGVLSLLLPVKLWQSLSGGGVRRLLRERATLLRVEDRSGVATDFDAAVYPSIVVARAGSTSGGDVVVAHADALGYREWRTGPGDLAYDSSPGAPWLFLRPPARAAFRRFAAAGVALSASRFGPPRLGVKSGCNAAFLVRLLETNGPVAYVEDADGERGKVESALLRPSLRGDAVQPWRSAARDERILWTHDDAGPLRVLPPLARAWLMRRYGALATRADGRSPRWWSLFRVDAARADRPRVVWADFGKAPRALVVPAGDPTVPLNSCYVMPCALESDAWALAAILNSPIAAAWLNAIAEVARGGYHRYLGWTVGQLPVPAGWDAARDDLARAGVCASRGAGADLGAIVLRAYGLSLPEVRDLLEPCGE